MDEWIRVTLEDAKKPMPAEWHGKILKVGKKGFARIDFSDMPKFWKNGNDGVVNTDHGWKEYKFEKQEGQGVMKIIGY